MKRLASVLALLGCILHATLLPWHVAYAKGAIALTEAAQLSQDLLIICHGDGTGTGEAADHLPQPPADQQQAECLVCKGLVGFQLVVLAAAEIGLLAPPLPERFASVTETIPLAGTIVLPRSRGPPLSV